MEFIAVYEKDGFSPKRDQDRGLPTFSRDMRCHSGDKSYEHKQCYQRFSESGSIKKKFGYKSCMCEQSDKRFCERHVLMRHMQSRTDEKPHRDSLCENSTCIMNIQSGPYSGEISVSSVFKYIILRIYDVYSEGLKGQLHLFALF